MQCPAVLLLLALFAFAVMEVLGSLQKKQASQEGKDLHRNLAFWRALEGLVAVSSSGQGCLL